MPVDARFFARGTTIPLSLPGLRLNPLSYSQEVIGGAFDAEIEAQGDTRALHQLFDLLGSAIEMVAGNGDVPWEGLVQAVEITLPTARIGMSLDGMTNRVTVVYTTPGTPAAPSGEQAVTPTVQNDLSVSAFGGKERRATLTSATRQEALALRDRILAERGMPLETSAAIDAGQLRGMIYCIGRWQTLGATYYQLLEGLIGFEETGDYDTLWTLAIGQHYYINTTISFIEAGSAMAVEDTTHTLAFQPRNHVQFYINGGESGRYVIASRDDDGGQFLLANPGNVYVHQRLEAGQTIALHPYGRSVAFSVSHDYTDSIYLQRIKLQAGKEGANLLDDMQVELHADSGGVPSGTPLSIATLNHAQMTESFAWADFEFTTLIELLPFTRYWLRVYRSSPNPAIDGVNFYMVQVNENALYIDPGGLGGALLVEHTTDAAGSSHAWQPYVMPHAPSADILFALEGARETTRQLESLILTEGQHLADPFIETPSGIYTVPHQDGEQTARQVAEALLSSGTTNNRRLLAQVSRERGVRIYEEPAPGVEDWLIASDGQLLDAWGTVVPPHRCPVGMWLKVQDLAASSGGVKTFSSPGRFVERATYDCVAGVLRPEARTPPAPWESLR